MASNGANTILLALFATFLLINGDDYYWRDWTGKPPEDAFEAGTNDGETIYVVQAYVKDRGLFIGYTKEHQTNIKIDTSVIQYSPLNVSRDIKVLCTRGEPFKWVSTTIDDTNWLLLNYKLFKAGFAEHVTNPTMDPTVYIGRKNESGNSFIGSVYYAYILYYSNGTLGLETFDYEILVMND